MFAMLVAVSAGFTEEVISRGLFLKQLRILTRSLTAAIYLQAVLFSFAHGAAQSLSQMLTRFLMGLLFAFFAVRRNSLWPVIFGHILLDTLSITAQYLKYR